MMKLFMLGGCLIFLAGAVCLGTALWVVLVPDYNLRIATGNLALGIFLGSSATLITALNQGFFKKQLRQVVHEELARIRPTI
jgi:hypothetical protein